MYAPIWRPLAVWIGLVLIVLTYIPLVWLVVMSFSDRPLSGIPHPLTLRWYDRLFATSAWIEPMTDSLWLALAVGACCVLVSVPVGRAIPRMKRRGGVLLITLLPLFVPGLTMGAALFLFIRSYMHFKLGMWSVFVGHMVWALPFAFLLVIVLATRFDHRLLEAAEDLGASAWKRFWQIEFPIMRPGIIGAGLFGFILSFNELLRSIFLRGTETTMPIYTWGAGVLASVQRADHFRPGLAYLWRHATDHRHLLLDPVQPHRPGALKRAPRRRRVTTPLFCL